MARKSLMSSVRQEETTMMNHFVALAMTIALAMPAYGQTVSITKRGKQPRVAVAPDGTVHVAFGQGDAVFWATSTNSGATYSPPVKVGEIEKLMCGMRRGPQIAATSKSVVITAIGRTGNIQCRRSGDGGRTWSDGARVNDKDGSAKEGLHAICAGAREEVFTVWLDLRDGKTKLFGAPSADGGKIWSKNVLVYESPDGSICECCQPSIVCDGKDTYYAMWRNSLGGNRDMWMARSGQGKSFLDPVKLGAGSWKLQACPMDGGSIAVGPKGNVITVWRRENDIYRCLPGQKEELLGNGRQPQMVTVQDSSFAVWERNGQVLCTGPFEDGPRTLGKGRYASVAAYPDTQASRFLVVWEEGEGVTAAVVTASQK